MNSKYMQLAIDEAIKGKDNGEMPFGCCLVSYNEKNIIVKHNEVLSRHNPLEHAEILALREKNENYNDSGIMEWAIYCTTKPCIMCLGAIYWSGVRNVYYGTDIESVNKLGIEDIIYDEKKFYSLSQKIHIHGKIMEDECYFVLKSWERKNKLLKKYLSMNVRNANIEDK